MLLAFSRKEPGMHEMAAAMHVDGLNEVRDTLRLCWMRPIRSSNTLDRA
jgi:hypothetical protein